VLEIELIWARRERRFRADEGIGIGLGDP